MKNIKVPIKFDIDNKGAENVKHDKMPEAQWTKVQKFSLLMNL
jgi:hypothetical protein